MQDDTEKREKQEELPDALSDVHASGSAGPEAGVPAGTAASNAGGAAPAGEPDEAAAPVAGEDNIAEFADSVVSGLEQAALALEDLEETPTPEPYRGSTGTRKGADAIFTAWSGFDICPPGRRRSRNAAAAGEPATAAKGCAKPAQSVGSLALSKIIAARPAAAAFRNMTNSRTRCSLRSSAFMERRPNPPSLHTGNPGLRSRVWPASPGTGAKGRACRLPHRRPRTG